MRKIKISNRKKVTRSEYNGMVLFYHLQYRVERGDADTRMEVSDALIKERGE